MLNKPETEYKPLRFLLITVLVIFIIAFGLRSARADCDVEYWDDLDYHSSSYSLELDPFQYETYCHDFYFYPDTGGLSLSVTNINNTEGSHAMVAIRPVLSGSWVRQATSTGNSVSVSYSVTYAEEWIAHIEYYAGGPWDEPVVHITHDPLDLDVKITSVTNPAVQAVYASKDDDLSFTFKVENIGHDDFPPELWEIPVELYADQSVTISNYTTHTRQDYWYVYFTVFQDETITLNISNPNMSSGTHFNVVAVVDPTPSVYPTTGNNALKIADIYWNHVINGFVRYNDLENWPGPTYPIVYSDYGDGIEVTIYNSSGYYLNSTYTDAEGDFEIEISQQSLPAGQTFNCYADLYEYGDFIVRDDATSEQIKIGYDQLTIDPAPIILSPSTSHNDQAFNIGLNARNMLNEVKQFLAANGITYNPGQVNFRVTSDIAPTGFNRNYNSSNRTIYLPERYNNLYYYNRIVQRQIAEMVLYDLVGNISLTTPGTSGLNVVTNATWAYIKGWDAFMAAIIPDIDVNAVSLNQLYNSGGYLADNIETNDWESSQQGEKIEGIIARLLFDLYDNSPSETYDNPPAHFNEKLNVAFSGIYNHINQDNPQDACDLANVFTYIEFQDQQQPWCNLMENAQYDMDFLSSQIGCIATSVFEREDASLIPEQFAIGQNYPNPFNSLTRLEFDIPRSGDVAVEIFDILGRRVYSETLEQVAAGHYSYSIDFDNLSGRHMASGIYLMKVTFGAETATRKMNYLK
nr:T9SS type A sorting domain-containing protein [candidate division Zixibacteria bacterium]